MPSYSAPIDDIKFVLQDVLEIHDSPIPGYSELDNAVSYTHLTLPTIDQV